MQTTPGIIYLANTKTHRQTSSLSGGKFCYNDVSVPLRNQESKVLCQTQANTMPT
jgi:hypothetical protein